VAKLPVTVQAALIGGAVSIFTAALTAVVTLHISNNTLQNAEIQARRAEDVARTAAEAARAATAETKAAREDLAKLPAIPTGAVLALQDSACPSGWEPFVPAQGRFIIGIGNDNGNNKASDGSTLNVHPLRNIGGNENVSLDPTNIPAHEHDISGEGLTGGNSGETARKQAVIVGGDTGYVHHRRATFPCCEGKPFRTLPPFIALNYCIKK
jgi:hypothetical protein